MTTGEMWRRFPTKSYWHRTHIISSPPILNSKRDNRVCLFENAFFKRKQRQIEEKQASTHMLCVVAHTALIKIPICSIKIEPEYINWCVILNGASFGEKAFVVINDAGVCSNLACTYVRVFNEINSILRLIQKPPFSVLGHEINEDQIISLSQSNLYLQESDKWRSQSLKCWYIHRNTNDKTCALDTRFNPLFLLGRYNSTKLNRWRKIQLLPSKGLPLLHSLRWLQTHNSSHSHHEKFNLLEADFNKGTLDQ